MFTLHPSKKLQDLFKLKTYQGVNPLQAKFIFIGLDANYSAEIDQSEIFEDICEYHLNAISYWENKKVHHPFMQKSYKGDGKKFHQEFAKIGLSEDYADQISFMEVLDKPTVGRNTLECSDLNIEHLKFINNAIFSGDTKVVFLCDSVARIMKKSGHFGWLDLKCINEKNGLSVYYMDKNVTVYKHLHFSNYGKFQIQKEKEAKCILKIITEI